MNDKLSTALDDLRQGAPVRNLWPDVGQALGLSCASTYRAAKRGTIPTLRLSGRLVVPVPKLLDVLGADQ
jgi:hypothetical protein